MKQMTKYKALFLVITMILNVFICFMPVSAKEKQADKTVGLTELVEHAKQYDDKEISFKGEAIGDVLYRGSNAWINVSDGNNSAIGVYMPAQTAKKISVMGHYGAQGDVILVTGIFHRDCPDHGGDMDIHADQVQILSKGYRFSAETPRWLVYLSGVSVLCAVLICAFALFITRRYDITKKNFQNHDNAKKVD